MRQRPTGLFVGLTTVDVVHRADRRPGPDEKVTATRQDVAAGGPAANAASTFAALGGRARLLSALGVGPVGRLARADLEAHGVEVLDAAAGTDYPLAVSAVLVEEATGRRGIVSADAALASVRVPDRLLDLVGEPDVVLLDGHHPALAEAVLGHLQRSRPATPVVLDGGRWKPQFARLLGGTSHAVLSADFRLPADLPTSRRTSGSSRNQGSNDDVPLVRRSVGGVRRSVGAVGRSVGGVELAQALRALGPTAVVITHGAGPVQWWDADDAGTHRPPAVPARDTAGAGDAFHGAFAAALAAGRGTAEAVELSSAVAAQRVTVEGPREWLADLTPWWPISR